MAKLGLARHRFPVAILCWLYVIFSVLIHVGCIFGTFYGSVFVIALINLLIGCIGLLALHKEIGALMKIYGIANVIIVVLQALQMFGLLMLTLYRESILNEFVRELMNEYYGSTDDREVLDDIQLKFQCCGRQSYKDWTITPYSCCKTIDCADYHSSGCVAALSPVVVNFSLVTGLLYVVSIIIHIYVVISAFKLAKAYTYRPIQPTIKHQF